MHLLFCCCVCVYVCVCVCVWQKTHTTIPLEFSHHFCLVRLFILSAAIHHFIHFSMLNSFTSSLLCLVYTVLCWEGSLSLAFATDIPTVHHTQTELAKILDIEKEKLSNLQKNACPYFTLPAILNNIKKNSQQCDNVELQNSMITTPCLDSDSFGNTLSDYIESRICSNITGYHFISVTPAQSLTQASNNPFHVLPAIVYNPGAGKKKSYVELKAICKCTSICHGK